MVAVCCFEEGLSAHTPGHSHVKCSEHWTGGATWGGAIWLAPFESEIKIHSDAAYWPVDF